MAEQTAQEKYEFKKKLESLRDKHGRGTELISLYIPPDKQISDVTNQLREEHGQAANIKSKLTKTNVQGALDSLLAKLRYLHHVPDTGVVYFTGAVDIGANKTSMESEVVVPPEPITVYKYHCDSSFHLEPLEDMLKDKATYGLVVIELKEATVGTLVGKKIQPSRYLTSTVPGKQGKGGQSAHRFEQLRGIAIHDFYKRVGDAADVAFLPLNNAEFKGILIGGHSPTKDDFQAGEFMNHELRKKIIGLFDTGYTDEYGLSELVNAASEELQGLDLIAQKKQMDAFFRELKEEKGKVAYGEAQVRANLAINAVDTLLLSDDLRAERVKLKCTVCDYENGTTRMWKPGEHAFDAGNCPKCGSTVEILDITDVIHELSELADKGNAKIAFISTDFNEGSMLMNAFGGIVAVLRYATGI